MKKWFLLVLLLTAAAASAFELGAEESVTIPVDSTKKVNITIESGINDSFIVTIVNEKPWMTLVNPKPKILAGIPETIPIYMSPFIDTSTGLYKVQISVESEETGEKKDIGIFVSVIKTEGVDIKGMLVKGSLEPLGAVLIELNARNYGPVEVNDIMLRLKVSSPGRTIFDSSENVGSIGPEETKTFTKSLNLEEQAEAGEYTINAELSYNGKTRYFSQAFDVEPKPVIRKEIIVTPMLFGTEKSVKITNYGNAPAESLTFGDSVSGIESVFFSGSEPDFRAPGTFLWKITDLAPGMSETIAYKIDYMPLFVFAAAVLVALWFVSAKMRTVRIRKYIMQKKMIEEGEEFTVGIDIRNATGSKIEEIVVKDSVPKIFDIKDTEGMKPRKKKTASGTELIWKLNNLNNREERVLSYRIIPIFGVHGHIRLPPAGASFELRKRKAVNRSLPAVIGVKEARKPVNIRGILRKKK